MKEKILYLYKCIQCKKENRKTYFKDKAEKGICRKCRSHPIDTNQLKIA